MSRNITLLAVAAVFYLIGAKFPQAANKIGL